MFREEGVYSTRVYRRRKPSWLSVGLAIGLVVALYWLQGPADAPWKNPPVVPARLATQPQAGRTQQPGVGKSSARGKQAARGNPTVGSNQTVGGNQAVVGNQAVSGDSFGMSGQGAEDRHSGSDFGVTSDSKRSRQTDSLPDSLSDTSNSADLGNTSTSPSPSIIPLEETTSDSTLGTTAGTTTGTTNGASDDATNSELNRESDSNSKNDSNSDSDSNNASSSSLNSNSGSGGDSNRGADRATDPYSTQRTASDSGTSGGSGAAVGGSAARSDGSAPGSSNKSSTFGLVGDRAKDGQYSPIVPNVVIRDLAGKVVYRGEIDLRDTLKRIDAGTKLGFPNDGSVFQNREQLLPKKAAGYYREWVHRTPGLAGPGPQRVVTGTNREAYYTPDHYNTFRRVR